MFAKMKKKGVSPVIAVVLMVAVAVALAVIIYAWASGYITGETGKASTSTSYSLISEEKKLESGSTVIYTVHARNTSIIIENATTAFDVYKEGVFLGTAGTTNVSLVLVSSEVGAASTWDKGEVWRFDITSSLGWPSGTNIKIVHKASGYELVVVVP